MIDEVAGDSTLSELPYYCRKNNALGILILN